mmetsp:Transcript_76017/g.211210  ORF Transcript_76017/g.211210 Transcript_76017/m.211210 type:complete len:281 (+) Transcript_76017:1168-2010(+)
MEGENKRRDELRPGLAQRMRHTAAARTVARELPGQVLVKPPSHCAAARSPTAAHKPAERAQRNDEAKGGKEQSGPRLRTNRFRKPLQQTPDCLNAGGHPPRGEEQAWGEHAERQQRKRAPKKHARREGLPAKEVERSGCWRPEHVNETVLILVNGVLPTTGVQERREFEAVDSRLKPSGAPECALNHRPGNFLGRVAQELRLLRRAMANTAPSAPAGIHALTRRHQTKKRLMLNAGSLKVMAVKRCNDEDTSQVPPDRPQKDRRASQHWNALQAEVHHET